MTNPHMKSRGINPIFSMPINGKYILAIYQGNLSKFDILIKYRQLENGEWSRIRTPKHIHWAVDILIKLYQDKKTTKKFISKLMKIWNESSGITTQEEFNKIDITKLYKEFEDDINEFKTLNTKGEYSVGFLILLLKLLMVQEKTNKEDAYMFSKILKKLKSDNNEIFSLISTATHNGR